MVHHGCICIRWPLLQCHCGHCQHIMAKDQAWAAVRSPLHFLSFIAPLSHHIGFVVVSCAFVVETKKPLGVGPGLQHETKKPLGVGPGLQHETNLRVFANRQQHETKKPLGVGPGLQHETNRPQQSHRRRQQSHPRNEKNERKHKKSENIFFFFFFVFFFLFFNL